MKNARAWAWATTLAAAVVLAGCTPKQDSVATPTPTPRSTTGSPAPTAPPSTAPPSTQTSTAPPAPKPPPPSPKPKPPPPSPKPKVITLYPVTAFFSQATVDKGKLVTWMTEPTCLVAGHDNMGWAWLDNIAVGTVVQIRSGPCYGNYVVYAHKWQTVKGGQIPSWMNDPGLHLVLQTCTGSTGTGFSLARRK